MSRLGRLRTAMQAHDIDAVVLVPGSNLRYVSGLGFSTKLRISMLVVPRAGTPVMVLPTMEVPRARQSALFPIDVYGWDDDTGPMPLLNQIISEMGLSTTSMGLSDLKIAVEHSVMRVFELRALERTTEAQICDADAVLAHLRMHKDADELAAMQRAITVAEESLAETIAAIRPGMTELHVAALWEQAIRARGSVPSFDIAVGSGPHGASPHHTNGDRPLQSGDLVVIDGGAIVDGYVSDITRTIGVGTLSDTAKHVYATVLAANEAGRVAAAQPDATGDSVDRAARAVIVAAGFGKYFIHRTGHGLGIDVHEPPFMVGGDTNRINEGMTFTVEPGIYLPGEFGVRIEDMMVRTADGATTMTAFPRALTIVE
ncbi:MAG: aminopeptidase P family protein [Chloroflexi bacterium]|nr:aminopeptidase P family protein [Chloroflexota bacterium]